MHVSRTFALRFAAIGVCGAAVLAPVTAAQADTAPPTLTVTPNTALTDGQSVAAAGAGFATATAYYVTECSALGSAADCDTSNVVSGTTDANGAFSTPFTVHTGTIGNGTCDASTTCYVVATTSLTAQDATNTATATIAFAAAGPTLTVTPNSNVKDGGTVSVSGSGFPASMTVYVLECSGTGGQQDCDISTLNASQQTDANGSFSGVTVTVHTGKVGVGKCKAGGTCYVAASTSTSGDPSQSAAAPFTFAKSTTAKTKTVAKFSHKRDRVVGTVMSHRVGVKGLKAKLEIRKHGKWKKVDTMKTHTGGAFSSTKLHRSGKYEVKTPRQTKHGTVYKASHSHTLKVRV